MDFSKKLMLPGHEQHNGSFDALALLFKQSDEVTCLDCNVRININSGQETPISIAVAAI